MADPITVEVYTLPDCPASAMTIGLLKEFGLTAEPIPMDRFQKASFDRQGYRLSPVVMVWMGEGARRVRYLLWDGYNPKMIETAASVAKASVA